MVILDEEKGLMKYSHLEYKILKVSLIGIYNSGKSTFVDRINSNNNFKNYKQSIKTYTPTAGAKLARIFVMLRGKLYRLDIWDCAGQENFFAMIKHFIRNSHINLYFYDPFNIKSFENIKRTLQIIKELNNKELCSQILIKSKCDLNETKYINIMISDEEALEFADKNNLLFRNLSNLEKYGSGIEEIIEDCIKAYLNKNNKN